MDSDKERKEYRRPELIVYGDLREITETDPKGPGIDASLELQRTG